MTTTLTVAELLRMLEDAVTTAIPGPVWVQGEVSEFKRTGGGAAFFRLVDSKASDHSIEVAARGRLMMDVDRSLDAAGVGALRSGIEVRLRGTVTLRRNRALVQLGLLEVDPTFTAGRLALDREQVLARLRADGTLAANKRLDLPIVPMRIGLVTSRGSAAHADFIGQLRRPGYRFSVRTVQAMMQGEESPQHVVRALERLASEPVDIVALVRGGGSKLDLAAFDSEAIGRAIAAMPVPVITGIGHETDRSVADEAAALATKTPTAAAEWIVARVADYARRLDTARHAIRDAASGAYARARASLDHRASQLSETGGALARQSDQLAHIRTGVADAARRQLHRHRELLRSYDETISAIGVEPTLRRGFALVTRPDGSVVRSVGSLQSGDLVAVRLADGTVDVTVVGTHV
ncbi:MAG: exodeoxyribonuclease VII large subunit [Acidimicrobiia bacterium]